MSLLLAMNRPPVVRNRLPLYLRKQTFSWPSLTSGCDPKATFGAAREKLFDTDSVRQYASALVNFFPGPVSFDSTKQ